MFHEDFVPITSWKNAIMTTWQRAQFWALGRQADVVGFSIEPWATRYQSWFPQADVAHWPVGSNIPYVDIDRETARSQLGIDASAFVAGVFGTVHESRMVPFIRQAGEALSCNTSDFLILYVGPDGDTLCAALSDLPVYDAGALPAEEVSVHLTAMDLHLTPFSDGASTRRGSFLAGLQHGVPTLSTEGPLTDPMLKEAIETAFLLTPVDRPEAFEEAALSLLADPSRRVQIGKAGQHFFDNCFRWDKVARKVSNSLVGHPTSEPPDPASI
jgi:glycosyltransferase involved in cell wall biosynthesis